MDRTRWKSLLLKAAFWVQIHNLPTGMYTEQMTKQFGKFIGEYVEYDAKTMAVGLRNFMRISILVDIRQPLKRKKKLILVKKKEIFAVFKYERLTTFCFIYG